MARIARSTQKIFADNASNNGVFGSARAGTFLTSNDVEALQALSAWDNGWSDATISGDLLPTLEEMQGIQYVATSQIAYLLQQGIPEWDAGTTYFEKNIVIKAGTYELYGSLVDDNLNNAVSDATKWVSLGVAGGGGVPTISGIGDAGKAIVVNSTGTAYILDNSSQFTTGDTLYSYAAAKTGWVLASGGTIGDASSGGTVRANADTEALFTLFWGLDATIFPIQTSAGAGSTRGASAAADFAAHKRMTIPDERGRVGAGRDDMGGSTASRITNAGAGIVGTTLGASGGEQTHALITAELASHSHTASVTDPGHTHGGVWAIGGATTVSGPTNNASFTGTTGSNTTGISVSNSSTGSGTAHQNTQPTIMKNVFIKL